MSDDRLCALTLRERDNLDAEMQALVRGLEKKVGFVPNFVRLFATDNLRLRAFMGQYLELMRRDSGLSPLEHEMIAVVSATTNGCTYCTAFHGMLLRGVAKDEQFADTLASDFTQAGLSPRHRAMLDFAVKVNRDAEAITEEDRAGLRAVGFDDEAIFMICSTAAFYAGANRLAQAIGLRPSERYASMHRAAPARATG